MEDDLNAASLLPYLDSNGTHFSLRLSLIAEDASALGKAPFPFLVITDSDPFSRLIEARMVTDTGSEIKRVFLLIQKDQYVLASDELRPINNRDIDAFWQRAFSLYESGRGNSQLITLASQIGRQQSEGEVQKREGEQKKYLLPFQSLFFCKKRGLFFAPPCPVCGLPIQQCYDDTLLIKLGLQPYSTSLKRYLFCPSCVASGKSSDFYTFGLESFASPLLKDRWDLIRGFRYLIKNKDHLDHRFLCRECPDMQECYGMDSHFLTRIVPFSFYPFHMFIVEAMSIHALDFLALISGAPLDELKVQLESRQEAGRAGCLKAIKYSPTGALMFFDQSEKYFLEVLYLKLSFLGEVIQKISTSSSGSGISIKPDLGLSLDQIWINLANKSGLLPFFWSFSVEILSLGEKPSENPSFSRVLPSYGLHVLGLIWFYTLLVNRKQTIAKVYQLLRETAANENGASSGGCLGGYTSGGGLLHQTFFPENIFWDPDERAISKSCHTLWEKSLNLGWSLLRASLHYSFQWSREEFWRQVETLRAEVKNALFQGNSSPGSQSGGGGRSEGHVHPWRGVNSESFLNDYRKSPEGNNGAVEKNNGSIHDILNRIIHKWREGVKKESPESGEEELSAWASSNRLGEWTPSNELWAHSVEIGALASPDKLGILASSDDLGVPYNEPGEKLFAKGAAIMDNRSEQDEFMAKVTVLRSERKIQGKNK